MSYKSVYDALADQYCRCAVGKCQGLRADQCANRYAPRIADLERQLAAKEAECERLREHRDSHQRICIEQMARHIVLEEKVWEAPHDQLCASRIDLHCNCWKADAPHD